MDGIYIRVAITLVAVIQAMIAALLGFAEILPQEWKVLLVVVAAGLAVLSNQIPSWQSAPGVERRMRKPTPPKPPRG